jgi:hypothetical protein
LQSIRSWAFLGKNQVKIVDQTFPLVPGYPGYFILLVSDYIGHVILMVRPAGHCLPKRVHTKVLVKVNTASHSNFSL